MQKQDWILFLSLFFTGLISPHDILQARQLPHLVPNSYMPRVPWGSDGNTAPEPRQGDIRSKLLCIADDLSEDHHGCEAFKTRNECNNSQKRCEFSEGNCIPWSVGNCKETFRESGTAFKKILLLSEYKKLQQEGSLGYQFANYEDIEVLYVGHGPELEDWIQIGQDVISAANRVLSLRLRSRGCSTFQNVFAAQKAWSNALSEVHEQAKTRLKIAKIENTANQLQVAEGSQSHKDYFKLESLMQTPFTLTTTVSPTDSNTLKLTTSAYECKSDLDYPVNAPERKCLPEDARNNRQTYCISPTTKIMKQEKCSAADLFSNTFDPRRKENFALVSVKKYEAYPIEFTDSATAENLPATFDYEGAIRACESQNGRIGEFYEVKAKLEGDNDFINFAIFTNGDPAKPTNSGWVWSSTSANVEGNLKYVYSLNHSRVENRTSYEIMDVKNTKGFVMCFLQLPRAASLTQR